VCVWCVQDLCERHEKGVVVEHQKTIQKLNQYKKKTNTMSHSHSAVSAATQNCTFNVAHFLVPWLRYDYVETGPRLGRLEGSYWGP